jgi:hypothetical protein
MLDRQEASAMAGRAKRLTVTIGAIALVAVIAGAVMVPDTIAAPKKGKPPKDEPPGAGAFVIEVEEEAMCCGPLGTFVATGAIQDSGPAGESWCDPRNEVSLSGTLGRMVLVISGDAFQIVEADGAYGDLVGLSGSHYTPDHEPTSWTYRRFAGTVPE